MGYLSASYRIAKWLEVGTYHSRFLPNGNAVHSIPGNYLFDQAVTARIDISRFLDFKIEQHFADGSPAYDAVRGFYAQENPAGLQPNMRLTMLRLEYHM